MNKKATLSILFLLGIVLWAFGCGSESDTLDSEASVLEGISLKEVETPDALSLNFTTDFYCVPGRGLYYIDMTKPIFENMGALYAEDGTFLGLNFKTLKNIDPDSESSARDLFNGLSDQDIVDVEIVQNSKEDLLALYPEDSQGIVCQEGDQQYNLCQDHTEIFYWYVPKEQRNDACAFDHLKVDETNVLFSTDENILNQPYFNVDLAHEAALKDRNIRLSLDHSMLMIDIPGNRYIRIQNNSNENSDDNFPTIGIAGGKYGNNHGDLDDTDLDGISNRDERVKFGTNPFNADHDGDGVSDGKEIEEQTDPTNEKDSSGEKDIDAEGDNKKKFADLKDKIKDRIKKRLDEIKKKREERRERESNDEDSNNSDNDNITDTRDNENDDAASSSGTSGSSSTTSSGESDGCGAGCQTECLREESTCETRCKNKNDREKLSCTSEYQDCLADCSDQLVDGSALCFSECNSDKIECNLQAGNEKEECNEECVESKNDCTNSCESC